MTSSQKLTQTILTLILLLISTTKSQEFSRTISKSQLNIKKQKLTHLHFYFHDTVTGRHPTVAQIASADVTNTSVTEFGFLRMMDDKLTVGPEPTSKIIGRAQGLYGSADLKNLGLLMTLNYYFTEGKFNGSTLSILGRNAILDEVREMPVVGGSGVFRFANGYAQARTHWFDVKSENAVVEYNVYVFHY